jgi:hypothetical protein
MTMAEAGMGDGTERERDMTIKFEIYLSCIKLKRELIHNEWDEGGMHNHQQTMT